MRDTQSEGSFATWGADNWGTLEEMTEDCARFTGNKQDIHEFALYMWHHGQDLVEGWEQIKHQKMLERN